jgi:hypothetical protein
VSSKKCYQYREALFSKLKSQHFIANPIAVLSCFSSLSHHQHLKALFQYIPSPTDFIFSLFSIFAFYFSKN